MKPALLVIDMQEVFFSEGPEVARSLDSAVINTNAAIELFRSYNLPIFVVEDIDESEGRLPGTPGFETTNKLVLAATDPRIHKTYGNAFNKTDLHQKLQDLDVDTLFLTGFASAFCVSSTFRGAKDLDYDPFLVRGATADASPERVQLIEEIHDLLSYGALVKMLELR